MRISDWSSDVCSSDLIQADADKRALAKVERAIAGIIAAIEDGLYQPTMKARMAELEREKTQITARLAEATADVPDVHPGLAEIYKRKVDRKSVVVGKSVSVRVDLGGRRIIKKK